MERRPFIKTLCAGVAAGAGLGAARKEPAVLGTGARMIPNVTVEGHDGRRYRLYDDLVQGRIVLFNFMYANCAGICPTMTSTLAQVQRLLGDRVGTDIFMYSFTLKPAEDTQKALRAFAADHGVGPGWRFLRASQEDTDLVRSRLGFVDSEPEIEADVEQHTGMVRIGNDAIDRWMACPGGLPARELVRAVLAVDPHGRPDRG